MIHRFYNLTPQQQFLVQLKLAILFLLLNIVMGTLLFFIGLPFLILFFFAISLSVLAPFIDVPSGVKAGSLFYYSPLLIAEKVRNNRLVLHSGSLFDYYFVLDKDSSAQERKKTVFSAYIDGLLNLINQYENKQTEQLSIKMTSYILNPRTAKKIGLKQTDTDLFQRIILYFNYINLTSALSLLNNKLTWPKMQNIYSYEGKLDSLMKRKADLLALQQRLKSFQ
ncbi:hypothetical protein AADZ91_09680 [Colwelliaceae bacterium 6441]